MKKLQWLAALALIICGISLYMTRDSSSDLYATDWGKLMPTKIERVVHGKEAAQLQQIVRDANHRQQKISIAGNRHSQGGHTFYPNGTQLDMRSFKRILQIDVRKRQITVQSGATWDDIQQVLNKKGLALQVTQSLATFTVGGSLSVNAHGRDIRYGSLASTVESLRLLTPKGEIINVSRTENSELLPLVLGGYGLFGVILDVTLYVTTNDSYRLEVAEITADEYAPYFQQHILTNPNIRMHVARLSVAPKSLLQSMYYINYWKTNDKADAALKEDDQVFLPKQALKIARLGGLASDAFWKAQLAYNRTLNGKLETRNNVMRAEGLFMEYDRQGRTEVLQEFFVPVENYRAYLDDVRAFLQRDDLNVVNITVRYVSAERETALNFAKRDSFALVALINHGTSKEELAQATKSIRQWTDITLKHNGTYYLPYYHYQTKRQLHRAYPNIDDVWTTKRQWDANETFVNRFYDFYK